MRVRSLDCNEVLLFDLIQSVTRKRSNTCSISSSSSSSSNCCCSSGNSGSNSGSNHRGIKGVRRTTVEESDFKSVSRVCAMTETEVRVSLDVKFVLRRPTSGTKLGTLLFFCRFFFVETHMSFAFTVFFSSFCNGSVGLSEGRAKTRSRSPDDCVKTNDQPNR